MHHQFFFIFKFQMRKELQLCGFICDRDNCIYLCRQLRGKLAMNKISYHNGHLAELVPSQEERLPSSMKDLHIYVLGICFVLTFFVVLTAVKDTANMTNMKTLENFGGSFPPAVFGRECKAKSLQHSL